MITCFTYMNLDDNNIFLSECILSLKFVYLNPFDGNANIEAAELGESENELPFRKRAESV